LYQFSSTSGDFNIGRSLEECVELGLDANGASGWVSEVDYRF